MPEPLTAVGLGAVAAYLGKDGIQKLLGPTADYLGQGLRDYTQKRAQTIGQIFQKAEAKLGEKLDTPGEVPPKVLKAVLDEGSFSNDSLAVEYLGGILASSRTERGRDDRGARIAKVVDNLSTYQLRTHYLVYSTVRKLFADSGLLLNMEGRPKMQIFIPYSGYLSAMDFSESELHQLNSLFSHIFFGLHGDNLLEGQWRYGEKEHIVKIYPAASEGGIVCQPSSLGVELFLWAFGHADKGLNYLFSPEFSPVADGLPISIDDACATTA
ncbi:hypothetical protein [Methylomonas fluvii]|uniref:DUF4393 domain-containing protein n=1 Tax=Methylomonas fluvii TaxID=1854564 RepID=A0ABR9DEY2_9GAMM|nr:hypothetical protein [Methylomonas fluvii]MBD9361637.1 hypothetical protein [Methylomonas fluvii]